jgi:hypothetical protein
MSDLDQQLKELLDDARHKQEENKPFAMCGLTPDQIKGHLTMWLLANTSDVQFPILEKAVEEWMENEM